MTQIFQVLIGPNDGDLPTGFVGYGKAQPNAVASSLTSMDAAWDQYIYTAREKRQALLVEAKWLEICLMQAEHERGPA